MKRFISIALTAAMCLALLPSALAKDGGEDVTADITFEEFAEEYTAEPQPAVELTSVLEGNGSKENPFIITDASDLRCINEAPLSTFKLARDINLGTWTPIATYSENAFTGTLDGDGHTITISGFRIEDGCAALIGWNAGTICNLTVNINISMSSPSQLSLGSIAAVNEGTITNCCTKGSINLSSSYYSSAYKREVRVGGLVGINNSMIEKSYSTADVTVLNYTGDVGGLVGYNAPFSAISDCYTIGWIRSGHASYVGGLVGYNAETIERSYAVESIMPTYFMQYGPLVGYNTGSINSSFYDSTVYGGVDKGKGTPADTKTMKTLELYGEWDFVNTWDMDSYRNNGYPFLRAQRASVPSQATPSPSPTPTPTPAPTPSPTPKVVKVSGVSIKESADGTNVGVDLDGTRTLTPVISPADATDKRVKWKSSDTNTASVNDDGVVTGVAEGTAVITVETYDGSFTADCTVEVIAPVVETEKIELSPAQLDLKVNESQTLTASVEGGSEITFKSNNSAVASVSPDGTVTGVAAGTTLIQAVSDTPAGMFTAFCTVNVTRPEAEVSSVKLNKTSLEMVEGKTVQLEASVKPANAVNRDITWSVSDDNIIEVNNGAVTARSTGTATVTASAPNGKSAVCGVTVLPSDTPAQISVDDTTIKAGEDVSVTVSIKANPGISTFMFDLTYDKAKLYPVSYVKGDVLADAAVTTPLGSGESFEDKGSVRFLCQTSDTKNTDSDGDLITVVFRTRAEAECGNTEIAITEPSFINQDNEDVSFEQKNGVLAVTDYTIGDVNCDGSVDLKDSLMLVKYFTGFSVTPTETGKKAAASIYPDGDDAEEPTLKDFQHLFRYLAGWQVELGRNGGAL